MANELENTANVEETKTESKPADTGEKDKQIKLSSL